MNYRAFDTSQPAKTIQEGRTCDTSGPGGTFPRLTSRREIALLEVYHPCRKRYILADHVFRQYP